MIVINNPTFAQFLVIVTLTAEISGISLLENNSQTTSSRQKGRI
jgi:hypothetical protein